LYQTARCHVCEDRNILRWHVFEYRCQKIQHADEEENISDIIRENVYGI